MQFISLPLNVAVLEDKNAVLSLVQESMKKLGDFILYSFETASNDGYHSSISMGDKKFSSRFTAQASYKHLSDHITQELVYTDLITVTTDKTTLQVFKLPKEEKWVLLTFPKSLPIHFSLDLYADENTIREFLEDIINSNFHKINTTPNIIPGEVSLPSTEDSRCTLGDLGTLDDKFIHITVSSTAHKGIKVQKADSNHPSQLYHNISNFETGLAGHECYPDVALLPNITEITERAIEHLEIETTISNEPSATIRIVDKSTPNESESQKTESLNESAQQEIERTESDKE